MKNVIRRWETFLRLERLTSASDMFKARTVYVAALGFFVVQLANFVQMYFAYGGWILDHTLLLVAVSIFIGSALSLRYHANFDFFSALWGVIILLGVGGTSLPTNVGINSALLPIMIAGTVLIALLGSRRSLIFYCLSASLMVICLYINSGQADLSVMSNPDYIALRNSQRTIQALIAITLCGLVLGLMSYSMTKLFQKLEFNLDIAQKAEAAKTQFLADMSHELRTPLNGVLGMNQLLLRTNLNDMQRNYAEIVDDCGKGMIVVIDDILDLSRLEADKIALTETAFNPAKMLESINALYQANANAKNIELNVIIEPGLPAMFTGDHGRLRQIISNLINNAIKFTDTGYVTVSMRALDMQNGRWWMNFFVQDSGIGITPDRQAKIFQRFEQAQDGQTNTVRGSGLGLAICRELTDLFGGEISVTSEPGKGSLFCVALPLAAVVLNKSVSETLPERPLEVVMKRGVA
ncbi:sensor histidine kinase [Algimonas arctica]|nr:ATP-binding protein [Algimonas arctica]